MGQITTSTKRAKEVQEEFYKQLNEMKVSLPCMGYIEMKQSLLGYKEEITKILKPSLNPRDSSYNLVSLSCMVVIYSHLMPEINKYLDSK